MHFEITLCCDSCIQLLQSFMHWLKNNIVLFSNQIIINWFLFKNLIICMCYWSLGYIRTPLKTDILHSIDLLSQIISSTIFSTALLKLPFTKYICSLVVSVILNNFGNNIIKFFHRNQIIYRLIIYRYINVRCIINWFQTTLNTLK